MSQAFAVQKLTPTKKTSEAANVPGEDLDETCLPDSVAISKPNFTSVNKTNQIKSEPMVNNITKIASFFNLFSLRY